MRPNDKTPVDARMVRLAAQRELIKLLETDDPTPFRVVGRSAIAGELGTQSLEEIVVEVLARGGTLGDLVSATGLGHPFIVAALVDLARGATIEGAGDPQSLMIGHLFARLAERLEEALKNTAPPDGQATGGGTGGAAGAAA